jgi:hypothetical protein
MRTSALRIVQALSLPALIFDLKKMSKLTNIDIAHSDSSILSTRGYIVDITTVYRPLKNDK